MKRRDFTKNIAIATFALSFFPTHVLSGELKTVDELYEQIINGGDKKRRDALKILESENFDKKDRETIVDRIVQSYNVKVSEYKKEFENRRDKLRFIGDDIKRKIDIATSFSNMDLFEAKHFSLKNVALNANVFISLGLDAFIDGYPVGSYPIVRAIVDSEDMQAKDIVEYIKSQSLETEFHDEDAAILFFLVAYKIKQSGLTFEEGKKYLYGEIKDWKDETSVGNPARVQLIKKILGYCKDESLTLLNIIKPQSITKWPTSPTDF